MLPHSNNSTPEFGYRAEAPTHILTKPLTIFLCDKNGNDVKIERIEFKYLPDSFEKLEFKITFTNPALTQKFVSSPYLMVMRNFTPQRTFS